MTPKKKRGKLAKKLLHKYRLVILNEDTFEEHFAIKLTRLNVFVISSLFTILLIVFTTLLIAFTPLREYIPGYSSVKLKRKALDLSLKVDSLTHEVQIKEQYYASIRKVLIGEVSMTNFNKDSIISEAQKDINFKPVTTNKQDSLLREKVAKEDRFNIFENATSQADFMLFPPVNGTISQGYNLKNKHYAVDIVVAQGTPVKATADGTVIFADWTIDTGYVVIIEHNQELISAYKHNSAITKNQGDLVKQGEVIAISGNTGKHTTGPHLHFELWSKGYPVNPSNFIEFL